MSAIQYLDMLRLSNEESAHLLDKLDADDMSRVGSNAASVMRLRLHAPLKVAFGDGTERGFRVLTRSFGSDQVSIVHGGYLHPGLLATLTITMDDGEQLMLQSTVSSCEHLTGNVHMMNLALASHLELSLLHSLGANQRKPDQSPLTLLGGSMLHVEKSDLDTKLLHQTLRDSSVNIVDVANGFGAIAAIEKHSYDAVLCDLTLPDMAGETLIQSLREHKYQGPIAIVTGIRDRGRLQGALAAGACDILLKPYLMERMVRTLSRVLPKAADIDGSQPTKKVVAPTSTMQVLARDMASLPAAVASREFDTVRFRLARVHGSARNARARSLEIAADKAVRALDRGGSIKFAAREISALLQEWETLSLKRAA